MEHVSVQLNVIQKGELRMEIVPLDLESVVLFQLAVVDLVLQRIVLMSRIQVIPVRTLLQQLPVALIQ